MFLDPFDEYSDDILSHLLSLERKFLVNPKMIKRQPQTFWPMRLALLSFLVSMHNYLKLSAETLFLTVNIIDRYVSKTKVTKEGFLLLGCTSLWIAAKYCEKRITAPPLSHIKWLSTISDTHSYYIMERAVLETLEWSVGCPTIAKFVEIYLARIFFENQSYIKIMRNIALYLAEKALFHQSLAFILPSVLAKCALHLAHYYYFDGKVLKIPFAADMTCMNTLWNVSNCKTESVDDKYHKENLSYAAWYVQARNPAWR